MHDNPSSQDVLLNVKFVTLRYVSFFKDSKDITKVGATITTKIRNIKKVISDQARC